MENENKDLYPSLDNNNVEIEGLPDAQEKPVEEVVPAQPPKLLPESELNEQKSV